MSDKCEEILFLDSSSRIIIAGYINQLPVNDFCTQHNLQQLVSKSTRVSCVQVKPERKHVYFRDVREHRKINMEKCLPKCDWSSIYNTNDVDKATTLLNDKISSIFNECFPLIKVKVSTRDPPYMSPLVKHLCNKRNKQIKIGVNPDIQERINKLIRLNQIRSVNEENRKYNQGSRKWWDTVNRIIGRKVKANNLSLPIDPKLMKHHFHNINTEPQYSTPEPLLIPEGTRIPVVDVSMVENFMMKQKSSLLDMERLCSISGADNY